MQDFFTYKTLETYVGMTTAVTLITEFIKNIKPFDKIPTRLLVLILSCTLILLTNIVTDQFKIHDILLYLLNALLVTSSAIGAWHVVTANKGKS